MCSGKMECTATLTSTKAMGKREMPSDPLYQEVLERAFMGEGPSARPQIPGRGFEASFVVPHSVAKNAGDHT